VLLNRLHKACFWQGLKLDKKTSVAKLGGFAHSILWICMGLSTDGVAGRIEAVVSAGSVAWPESEIFFRQAAIWPSLLLSPVEARPERRGRPGSPGVSPIDVQKKKFCACSAFKPSYSGLQLKLKY
jgi:hypothetical protein